MLSASSLNQQSARHVPLLGQINLILSQPVIPHTLLCCILNGKTANTNLIVIGLTQSELEPTIYHTQGEHVHHYITNAVFSTLGKILIENIE